MKWLGVTVFCLVQAVKLLIALALTFPLAAQQVITKNQADDQIIIFLDQPASQGGSLLADPEHPDRVRVNIGGLPYIGVNDAPVTMIEFTDLQCPYCAFDAETYHKIRQAFVDTSKVRLVHWDLPLAIHSHALFAAQAARCARDQNKFWNMRDWMGEHSQELDLDHVVREANIELHLDDRAFRYCLATGKYKEAVEKEAAEASGVLHLTGEPAFVIGKTAAIVDGEVVIGPLPYEAFEAKLAALSK